MVWRMHRYEKGMEEARAFWAHVQVMHNRDLAVERLKEECRKATPDEYESGWAQVVLEVLREFSFIEAAKWILENQANKDVRDKVARLERHNLGDWTLDPEVEGVVGFVYHDDYRKAWVVFYTEERGDFETAAQFDDLTY